MARAADVFISYKAEDRRRIQPLVQALQADGHSVWWDQHIGTGDEWRETIERQLDVARCVIVAWSKRSVGSESARKKAIFASISAQHPAVGRRSQSNAVRR